MLRPSCAGSEPPEGGRALVLSHAIRTTRRGFQDQPPAKPPGTRQRPALGWPLRRPNVPSLTRRRHRRRTTRFNCLADMGPSAFRMIMAHTCRRRSSAGQVQDQRHPRRNRPAKQRRDTQARSQDRMARHRSSCQDRCLHPARRQEAPKDLRAALVDRAASLDPTRRRHGPRQDLAG